jgi:hypothetical protein
MQASNVKLILSAPYYDPKHAAFVARNSGAKIAKLAHQIGSRPGATDYLAMVDLNIGEVVNALKAHQ